MGKREFDAKVIGKWIKGIIWKRPYLSVEFEEDLTPKYYDLPVSMAFWHAAEKGALISVTMYQWSDGLWYAKSE